MTIRIREAMASQWVRIDVAMALVVVAALGGCVVPYAYPRLAYTPGIKLGTAAEEVRAFRVDHADLHADLSDFSKESLVEVPITANDDVPSQMKASMATGYVVIGVALNFTVWERQTVAMRLYRPGYELVEIKSWQPRARVVWKRVPNIEGQERALAQLFGKVVAPETTAQRQTISFGATEYRRLAETASTHDDSDRLIAAAERLDALLVSPHPETNRDGMKLVGD